MREKQGVSRRTALKLAAAGGANGLTRAIGLGNPRSAFAQGSDTRVAGWSRDKFERLDPRYPSRHRTHANRQSNL